MCVEEGTQLSNLHKVATVASGWAVCTFKSHLSGLKRLYRPARQLKTDSEDTMLLPVWDVQRTHWKHHSLALTKGPRRAPCPLCTALCLSAPQTRQS